MDRGFAKDACGTTTRISIENHKHQPGLYNHNQFESPIITCFLEMSPRVEIDSLPPSGSDQDPGDPETHWHRDDEAIGLPALHQGEGGDFFFEIIYPP